MAVSGETAEPAATSAVTAPTSSAATNAVPDGYKLVKETEFNDLAARSRTSAAKLRDREKADDEAATQAEADKLAAAGKFDEALAVRDREKDKLATELRQEKLGNNLSDTITSKGYAGEQARALKDMVDRGSIEFDGSNAPIDASVSAAVDSVVAKFPSLFKQDTGGDESTTPATQAAPANAPAPRTPGPSATSVQGQLPEGYISLEQYHNTDRAIRMTPEFQELTKRSEPFWPKFLKQNELQSDPS